MKNVDVGIPLSDLSPTELTSFKTCSFLVNLLSQMYEQYQSWIKEHPLNPRGFIWNKSNVCPVTSDFRIEDWTFGALIWSKFKLIDKTGKVVLEGNEPFGCIAKNKDGNVYLVFRGSKSLKDFIADAQMAFAEYEVPSPKGVRKIYVEKGFYSVYAGLRDDLLVQLTELSRLTKKLTITGHSLGSALATLAVPDAVSLGFNVKNHNTASPRVGLESFKVYYESLKVEGGNIPGCLETIRIVNEEDSVPKLPPTNKDYEHVGIAADYSGDYGSEANNHNPCCSYGYTIYHPSNPLNPEFGLCCDPKESVRTNTQLRK